MDSDFFGFAIVANVERLDGLSLSSHEGQNRVVVALAVWRRCIFFFFVSVQCILVLLLMHLRLLCITRVGSDSSSLMHQLYILRVSTYGPLDGLRRGSHRPPFRGVGGKCDPRKVTENLVREIKFVWLGGAS